MKPFQLLTDNEVLGLTNEELNDAIRIGAIEQGIQPPLTLSEQLKNSEWRGYQQPAGGVVVWEIGLVSEYHGTHSTGLAYLDPALAERAREGAVLLRDTYDKGFTIEQIKTAEAVVIRKVITDIRSPAVSKAAKFAAYSEDSTEFDKFRDECVARYERVRQDDYNRRVNIERRAEYLRLAKGDVEVAKAFWSKAVQTPWPSENGLPE